MNNYDANDLDCAYVQCAVCDKAITGGKWFARIKHGDWMIALCFPSSLRSSKALRDVNFTLYFPVRRITFIRQ